MGLYDYLGRHQVKCFPIPVVKLNKPPYNEFNREGIEVYSISGDLRHYSKGTEVPHKTLFCNYGKDFMVFDYRTFDLDVEDFDTSDLWIHIIKDGCYLKSVPFDKLPKTHKIGLVIDKYGDVLNIKSAEDFKTIVHDCRAYHQKYDELNAAFLSQYGVKNVFELGDKLSEEKAMEILNEYNEVSDKNYEATLKVFRSIWYNTDEDVEDKVFGGWIIGALYSSYLAGHNSEAEWNDIIPLYDQELKRTKTSNLRDELEKYADWCKKNEISVDIQDVSEFIDSHWSIGKGN